MRLMFPLCLLFLLISCKSKEGENWNNLQNVKVGMSLKEATRIMGKAPNVVDTYNDTLVLFYESPAAASDDYRIVVSRKDSIVVEVG